MPLPTLPPEIMHLVFASTWFGGRIGHDESLARFSRVCKSWMHPAQVELYRELYLNPGGSEATHAERSRGLVETLTAHPTLAILVRRLSLCYFSPGEDRMAYDDALRRLANVCTRLTSLFLRPPSTPTGPAVHPSDGSLEESLRQMGPQLRELSVASHRWSKDMGGVLQTFTSLKKLELEELDDDAIGTLSPAPMLKLESFQGIGLLRSQVVQGILAGSLATLEELVLDEETSGPLFKLESFVALRRVHLGCNLETPKARLVPFIQSIASCITLEELQIDDNAPYVTPRRGLASLDLLRIVPFSIPRLLFPYVPLETDYLLAAFADSRCLVNVKYMQLDHRCWGDSPDDAEDTKDRPVKEWREIIEASEKRGIELYWRFLHEVGWDVEPEEEGEEGGDLHRD